MFPLILPRWNNSSTELACNKQYKNNKVIKKCKQWNSKSWQLYRKTVEKLLLNLLYYVCVCCECVRECRSLYCHYPYYFFCTARFFDHFFFLLLNSHSLLPRQLPWSLVLFIFLSSSHSRIGEMIVSSMFWPMVYNASDCYMSLCVPSRGVFVCVGRQQQCG